MLDNNKPPLKFSPLSLPLFCLSFAFFFWQACGLAIKSWTGWAVVKRPRLNGSIWNPGAGSFFYYYSFNINTYWYVVWYVVGANKL